MKEKHIIIDEKAIYDQLYAQLDDTYTLTFCDYRDEISPSTLADILENGFDSQLSEVFADQQRFYARKELDALLEKQENLTEDQRALFTDTDEYYDLLYEIESRDDSEAEKEIFTRSRIRTRIMLHSNYDCWLPLWETQGLYGKDDALEGLMKMLCLNPAKVKQEAIKKGIACHRAFPNLKYREGKEIVSYEGFVQCLIECPNYGLWTFFGYFDMAALWDAERNAQNAPDLNTLVIPKGTTCTMFNDWNGGGSLEFTETIRPVTLAELSRRGGAYDGPKVYVDEKYNNSRGYSSGEVYGGSLGKEEILCPAA